MWFSELSKLLTNRKVACEGDGQVSGIAYDSRKVGPGDVFIAIQGGSFDGHQFIAGAIDGGASAIIAERKVPEAIERGVPYVVVPNGRIAMGEIAAAFYGNPSRKIKLIGVTGTSGKTTVTHLIQSVFQAAGMKAGIIGTLGAKIDGELIETEHTTPESVDVQRIMARMVEKGVEAVAMEVSSHGLYQGRALGCEFDCGVFTNIARDHLDFHVTEEAYLDAKIILFRDIPKLSDKRFHAVINNDDTQAQRVMSASQGSVITFGLNDGADVVATDAVVNENSVAFTLSHNGNVASIRMGIGGAFNVYNALSAAAVGLAFGLNLDIISKGLANAQSVPGRFESVECGQDFGVIVDYAHTPDELENVLQTARTLTDKRLIAVFGCGGDRDKGKRPIMGRIGTELADVAVITSDNPRKEDPDAIIKDILDGISPDKKPGITVQMDRREAIFDAVRMAESGDLIVIAGKGHEDYQVFADRTIHFSDREVAAEALTELGKCRQ